MRADGYLREALVASWSTAPRAVTARCRIGVSGAVFENRWGERHQRGAASGKALFVGGCGRKKLIN